MVAVPPTLRALLAARLDQLDSAERSVLERGAVEGEVFHRGAVQALGARGSHVTPRLAALVRKGLILSRPAQLAGRGRLPLPPPPDPRRCLRQPAEVDARPSCTSASRPGSSSAATDLVELDELLGYHLEQAWRYRHELGDTDDHVLAAAARQRLAAAAQRALFRRDFTAALNLVERALALVRPGEIDAALEIDRIEALAGSGRMALVLLPPVRPQTVPPPPAIGSPSLASAWKSST